VFFKGLTPLLQYIVLNCHIKGEAGDFDICNAEILTTSLILASAGFDKPGFIVVLSIIGTFPVWSIWNLTHGT